MIEALTAVLPVIIYLLLIVLLVVVIVLGIKTIIIVDKVSAIVKEVEDRVQSLKDVFRLVEMASSKLNYFGTRIIDSIISKINKIIGASGKDEEDYE